MKQNTTEAADAATVEVTLIMPHTHAGTDYNIGETLDVLPSEKQWLIDHGRVADDKDAAA
jgi:hypothetical protein